MSHLDFEQGDTLFKGGKKMCQLKFSLNPRLVIVTSTPELSEKPNRQNENIVKIFWGFPAKIRAPC